ncbi:MAG: hypothetical protein QOI03_704 [Solirubrobacteraceae bacterium]|nr:hypothetical protein [Solirubrobacteraceae bacterium]
MRPDAAHPERGSFVRDQYAALARIEGVDVELYEFAPGARALARAALDLRRRFTARSSAVGARAHGAPLDVVHAHFGLSAWPSLAVRADVHALTVHGTDLHDPRTRVATAAALARIDLLAAVSATLAAELPGRVARQRALVLPCGVDLERFWARPRAEARAQLGLDLAGRYLLFPADPAREEKRHDRALSLARAANAELLVLRGVEPSRVPLWVNGANAVVVTSEREGFGLAALEALACDVPVLATPVGVHADALGGIDGVLCAPFELNAWLRALEPHLDAQDPRVRGRASVERFSTSAMAAAVVDAWSDALERSRARSG